jgi:cytochrome oxidase Cu insertion factor (SCO1/SenC/PrrC family)
MGAGAQAGGLRHRGVRPRVAIAVVAMVAAVGIGLGVVIHLLTQTSAPATAARSGSPPARALLGQATWRAGQRPAPNITTLRDQSGRLFSLASLHGRSVAMEFFDSHCHAECPLAGRALAAAERSVPRAQRPVLVVVSVNPKDTPASARAAVRNWGLAGLAPWHWLMGTHARLAPVWSAYHIYVQPARGDISHTEALYLIDRRGDERSGYLYPYMPTSVSHDLKVLAPIARRSGGAHA